MVSTMETVTVNGVPEVRVLVVSTTVILNELWNEKPIVAYEAISLARDPGHQLFGNAGKVLEDMGLTQNGEMHRSVRNIISASFHGDELEMEFVPLTQIAKGDRDER